MERLLQHTVEILTDQFDVTLIGPDGCGQFAPKEVAIIECPATPFSFLTMALLRGWRPARKKRFDIVLGGSGLVAPVTWTLSRIAKARSVIFVHGLDLVVDNWVYQQFFVPFLRRHGRIIANSQNTRKLAINKGCTATQIEVINPGSTIPPESLLLDVDSIRKKLGFENNRIILFVGRMVRRKGLAEFLEKAWPQVLASVSNARLLVVGDTPDNALLQDPKGAQRLVKAIERCGKDTVRFLGNVEDDTLWNCYAAASALVFPLVRVKGDVEGFGMVAIEAAACGTPTVAFSVGGVPDAIADRRSGILVAEDDYPAFADAVIALCNNAQPTAAECRTHARRFSWGVFRDNLLAVFDRDHKT